MSKTVFLPVTHETARGPVTVNRELPVLAERPDAVMIAPDVWVDRVFLIDACEAGLGLVRRLRHDEGR